MSQLMRLWYLSVKARASLRIYEVDEKSDQKSVI